MHPSGPAHEMAITASAPGVWEATTPHEVVPTPSATRPVPEAQSRIRWVHGSEPPAIVEAATPLAVPSSPLAEPPAASLEGATPASASVLKPAPTAPSIAGAAEARLESFWMRQPVCMAPCTIAERRMPILISWWRAQHTPAGSVAAERPFPRPASVIIIPTDTSQARAVRVHDPCARLPPGGGGGGYQSISPACVGGCRPSMRPILLLLPLCITGSPPFWAPSPFHDEFSISLTQNKVVTEKKFNTATVFWFVYVHDGGAQNKATQGHNLTAQRPLLCAASSECYPPWNGCSPNIGVSSSWASGRSSNVVDYTRAVRAGCTRSLARGGIR